MMNSTAARRASKPRHARRRRSTAPTPAASAAGRSSSTPNGPPASPMSVTGITRSNAFIGSFNSVEPVEVKSRRPRAPVIPHLADVPAHSPVRRLIERAASSRRPRRPSSRRRSRSPALLCGAAAGDGKSDLTAREKSARHPVCSRQRAASSRPTALAGRDPSGYSRKVTACIRIATRESRDLGADRRDDRHFGKPVQPGWRQCLFVVSSPPEAAAPRGVCRLTTLRFRPAAVVPRVR